MPFWRSFALTTLTTPTSPGYGHAFSVLQAPHAPKEGQVGGVGFSDTYTQSVGGCLSPRDADDPSLPELQALGLARVTLVRGRGQTLTGSPRPSW